MSTPKKPIINSHAHVFTGDYVPPYLAKTYLPPVLYHMVSLKFVIKCLRWYYGKVKPLKFKNNYKWFKRMMYQCEMFFKRYYVLGALKLLIELYLIVAVFFYVGKLFIDLEYQYQGFFKKLIQKALVFLNDCGFIITVPNTFFKIVFFLLILTFFKSIRNLVFALLRQFKILPGKHITALFYRYVQIGLFSKYKKQSGIYAKLKRQYPKDTHFVGLPMDMEFMDAGDLSGGFNIRTQMEGLAAIKQKHKDTFHPFIFADPRRITSDPNYFKYTVDKDHNVILDKDCLVKQWLDAGFSGIKIYPALGYYPFDEVLLPLWKYCSDHNIPIMSHCIKGTIFYRGKKKNEWDTHPIFTEGKLKDKASVEIELDIESDYIEHDAYNQLYLNEVKNIDFCNNFTNPLNYLCLLDEKLLYKVIKEAKDPKTLEALFPCDDKNETVIKGKGLSKLKLCFAHFGGDDQWKRFLESDRDNYTSQLLLRPKEGIDFFNNSKGLPSPGKLAYIWKYVDWYTIICSIMLQYDNVYADISYILHDEIILPLLKQTLSNRELNTKVLYGSDFYVVRNHKSDKAILADMRAGLTEAEFDQIARENPRVYLNLE